MKYTFFFNLKILRSLGDKLRMWVKKTIQTQRVVQNDDTVFLIDNITDIKLY